MTEAPSCIWQHLCQTSNNPLRCCAACAHRPAESSNNTRRRKRCTRIQFRHIAALFYIYTPPPLHPLSPSLLEMRSSGCSGSQRSVCHRAQPQSLKKKPRTHIRTHARQTAISCASIFTRLHFAPGRPSQASSITGGGWRCCA